MNGLNQRWASALVDELIHAGLRHVCVAPGSRSTPVVLAIAARPELATYVHLDERSAAFFALGIGKAVGEPAAVLTTSGTAVANLLPAVVEAAQSETPLILLTADRPPELRGADANQAIDQIGIFGAYVRASFNLGTPDDRERSLRHVKQLAARAWKASSGVGGGPVHVNLPFRKPLEPERNVPAESLAESAHTRVVPSAPTLDGGAGEVLREFVREAARGLLVAGPAAPGTEPEAVLQLARSTGFPVLADPLSGVRAGLAPDDLVVAGYDLLLGSAELRRVLRPDAVLRVGRSPTSQRVLDWLEQGVGSQMVLDPGPVWKDHLSVADVVLEATASSAALCLQGDGFETPPQGDWQDVWRKLSETVRSELESASEEHVWEGSIALRVGECLPAEANLFLSNSMPVRDADAYLLPQTKRIHFFGNRGASGIDGIISTAFGIAAASRRPTVALVGDIAFFHDSNGLMGARHLDVPCVLVLVNNDGGGIFDRLPIRSFEPAFTKFFTTPHGLDFRHASRLHGLEHEVVEVRDVGDAVAHSLSKGGVRVVEVRLSRAEQDEHQRAVAARIRAAGERTLRALQLLDE